MKYNFIHQYGSGYGVEKMCRVLGVSRSGYYHWLDRPESTRSRENQILVQRIKQIYQQFQRVYGSPRITRELWDRGFVVSRPRVARLMRKNHIQAKQTRRFRITTQSDHTLPISPNLLNQDFVVNSPRCVWVSDITYIATRKGWLYLTVIIDLFQRKVVGWAMSRRLTANQTVIAAFQQARKYYHSLSGLIFHSDRGVQYASESFRHLLAQNGIRQSMSGKGNCYDNAVAESFFKTLKTELVYHQDYLEPQHAQSSLFEYIECFYNRIRKHSTLGYLSPVQYEQQYAKSAA